MYIYIYIYILMILGISPSPGGAIEEITSKKKRVLGPNGKHVTIKASVDSWGKLLSCCG